MFKKGRILKTHTNKKGYVGAGLRREKRVYTLYVHRLVAKAFVLNPDNLPQVNHINRKRNDNRVKNIEWVSSRENNCHRRRRRNKHRSNSTGVHKLRADKWVSTIYHDGKRIRIGNYLTEEEAHMARVNYEKEKGITNRYLRFNSKQTSETIIKQQAK